MNFLRENTKSIVVGIVSSVLFLYFFQPILDFIGRTFLRVLSAVSSKYSDDFYSKIAHLELFDFSFFWLLLVFTMLCTVALSLSIRSIRGKQKANERKNREIKNSEKYVFFAITLVTVLFLILFMATKIYQLRLITSFKQHMLILAPYVTDQEEEELYSRGSLMNSEKDYNDIYIELNKIANKQNVVLPENGIYSFSKF